MLKQRGREALEARNNPLFFAAIPTGEKSRQGFVTPILYCISAPFPPFYSALQCTSVQKNFSMPLCKPSMPDMHGNKAVAPWLISSRFPNSTSSFILPQCKGSGSFLRGGESKGFIGVIVGGRGEKLFYSKQKKSMGNARFICGWKPTELDYNSIPYTQLPICFLAGLLFSGWNNSFSRYFGKMHFSQCGHLLRPLISLAATLRPLHFLCVFLTLQCDGRRPPVLLECVRVVRDVLEAVALVVGGVGDGKPEEITHG